MIVANRKTLEEILGMLKPYKKVLLLGCNECVTVCAVGGEREVGVLASEIRLARAKEGQEIEVKEQTLERQCDHEYIDQVRPFVGDYEVILSIACGAGIQYVAEKYRTKVVLPGVNTTFLGVTGVCLASDGGSVSDLTVCEEFVKWSLWGIIEWEV
jgi:hypothetical protein